MLSRIAFLLVSLSFLFSTAVRAAGHGDCGQSGPSRYVDASCEVTDFRDDGRPLNSEYGYQAPSWSGFRLPESALYVDAEQGKDAASGTKAQPLRSIAKALQQAKPGQTVVLRGGVYREAVDFPRSGEPNKPIRLMGYPQETARIVGDGNAAFVVRINGKSYVELNNLHVRFAKLPEAGKGVRARAVLTNIELRRASHSVIANVQIVNPTTDHTAIHQESVRHNVREMGIVVQENSEHNVIVNNHISGMLSQALMLGRGGHYNVFIGNSALHTLGNGFMLDAKFGEFQNTLIERNRFMHSVMSDGIQSNHDFETKNLSDTSAMGLVIRHNLIGFNGENGIDIKGSSHLVIEHNYIFGNRGVNNGGYDGKPAHDCLRGCTASAIMIGSHTSSRNVILRHNTVFDNPGGIAFWHRWIIYNNTIVNNRRYDKTHNLPVVELGNPRLRKPVKAGLEGWGNEAVIINNLIGNHRDAEVVLIENEQSIDRNAYFNQLQNNKAPLFAIDYDGSGKSWQTRDFAAWQAYLLGLQVQGQEQGSRLIQPSRLIDWRADQLFNTRFTEIAAQGLPAARDLTTTLRAGEGKRVQVADSRYFFTGFGVTLGDEIEFASSEQSGDSQRARVLSISANELRLDRSLRWQAGDGVRLYRAGQPHRVGAH